MGWVAPQEPALFFKPVNTMIGPEDDIVYTSVAQDLRYEAELCFVMKREAKGVYEKEALEPCLGLHMR